MTKREKRIWDAEGRITDALVAIRKEEIRRACQHLEVAVALLEEIEERDNS